MPLKAGYSRKTVQANIAAVFQETGDNAQSVAVSYATARKSYFRHFPGGALPEWLAFPKGYRQREHYDRHGKPRFALRGVRANPTPPPREVQQAVKLFENFTGYKADRLEAIPLAPLPKTGLAFGELVEIGYISFRDGEPYRHTFRLKRSRPLLVASHDGKQVLLIGGSYAFTERGIEDR